MYLLTCVFMCVRACLCVGTNSSAKCNREVIGLL